MMEKKEILSVGETVIKHVSDKNNQYKIIL